MKALPLILEDKPLPRYMGIDAFNAREQARKQNLSLKQVQEELLATHEAGPIPGKRPGKRLHQTPFYETSPS